ncbi:glycine--tRNA ligase subunit alpha [Orientia tsutsugamushi]|uniref:Glycine--tRNA ligase alpha subunit n=1 Tax=Orientia tsutsugamushi str. TA716 TaxID=1359175 RepID=A0A0F3PAZ8_ORITS|nr:glycine--tRNA ligase subunit alpha [Orientia tsutsugamushi]KJV77510.1 glycine--tRNA ligase, alpha subunit [Orientia tsutsugamushi str. TA716]
MNKLSFQQIIMHLQQFWCNQGCAILQPYDVEIGAGTFHPATAIRLLGQATWHAAYVQPSRRPTDSRYGSHPNRLQQYYQFQVIIKPSPDNIQALYLHSLEYLNIKTQTNDIRFVEDDWQSPTLGASGLGWEVWCNGMEISQITYLQQIASIECNPIPIEVTYGLERLAMYIQEVDDIKLLNWNNQSGELALTYQMVNMENERQFSAYNLEYANTSILFKQFEEAEQQCQDLVKRNLPLPAYDFCLKASHLFNLLDSRGVIGVTQRTNYIARIRTLAQTVCNQYIKNLNISNA